MTRAGACLLAGAIVAAVLLSAAPSARAACANPSGQAGDLVYNQNHNVAQYCNGADWIAAGQINPAAGSGTCANPTGSEGQIVYNQSHSVMQFCNGQSWIAMGSIAGTGTICGFSDGTCPPANQQFTGCLSGRTLEWTNVSCGTAGSYKTITLGSPKFDESGTNISLGGVNAAEVNISALYWCMELGLTKGANPPTFSAPGAYYAFQHNNLATDNWVYATATTLKILNISCADKSGIP